MTNQQIRLQFGEMTASEMWLVKAVLDWKERQATTDICPTCKISHKEFLSLLHAKHGIRELERENEALREMLKESCFYAFLVAEGGTGGVAFTVTGDVGSITVGSTDYQWQVYLA